MPDQKGLTNVKETPVPVPVTVLKAADVKAMNPEEVGKQMPVPKTVKDKMAGPSPRTLKKQIKELTEANAAMELEVQRATDKALMFQEIANGAKDVIDQQQTELRNTLVTIRGSVVNAINIIDMVVGGMKND